MDAPLDSISLAIGCFEIELDATGFAGGAGAVGGAMMSVGVPPTVVGAVTSGLENAGQQLHKKGRVDAAEFGASVAVGAALGYAGNRVVPRAKYQNHLNAQARAMAKKGFSQPARKYYLSQTKTIMKKNLIGEGFPDSLRVGTITSLILFLRDQEGCCLN